MLRRISAIALNVIFLYAGAFLGAVLILLPLRFFSSPYSSIVGVIVFGVGVWLFFKGSSKLFSVRVDYAQVADVFDGNLRTIYKSTFFIGTATAIVVAFLINLVHRIEIW